MGDQEQRQAQATDRLRIFASTLLKSNTGSESFSICATGGSCLSVDREFLVAFVGGVDPGREPSVGDILRKITEGEIPIHR